MPVEEHETISELLSPVQIIATALQRAAQSRATCPPDEVRPNANNRLPPALVAEEEETDANANTEQPHEVTIEPLSLLETPLSTAARSLGAPQAEQTSDAPDFAAAYGEVKIAPDAVPSSPVAVASIAPPLHCMEQALTKVCRTSPLEESVLID